MNRCLNFMKIIFLIIALFCTVACNTLSPTLNSNRRVSLGEEILAIFDANFFGELTAEDRNILSSISNSEKLFLIVPLLDRINARMNTSRNRLLDPYETERFEQKIGNTSISGIGITVAQEIKNDTKHFVIERVFKSHAADLAGLRAGDEIIQINHTKTRDLRDIESVVQLIRGAHGSSVELLIKRDQKLIRKSIMRAPFTQPSFEKYYAENTLTLIFNESIRTDADTLVQHAVKTVTAHNNHVSKIVFDLTAVRGGNLRAIRPILRMFAKKGRVFSRFIEKENGQEKVFLQQAPDDGIYAQIPLVVKISPETAGGAVYLAYYLSQFGADVIGERKKELSPYITALFKLSNGYSLLLVKGKLTGPKGEDYTEWSFNSSDTQ